ncbi:MAG: bifunctional tetrahydrofolate synthase/dihydrofolate synthase [Rickettsiella sp.]|nr:bifunctional tetrahydrofolate synthase/dihydrofolate synthase [Rickettsiella sp.]
MLRAIANSKQDWLKYLENCHPKSIDLGLDRIKIVARRLELLHFDCPVISVAGTNGKGSCVALTHAILTAAGYRVASYTSPHLIDFNERIQIEESFVSDAALCMAFETIEHIRREITLTYFEFTTLAALWLFKQVALDIIILEVGLGGRLDAVNCVDADIAVISTVDLDHLEWLGDTRELIAREKAGIMRSNKPCVFGDFSLPSTIVEQANALNTPLYLQGKTFDYKIHTSTWSWQSQQQTLVNLPLPKVDLQNAATVLQIIELLSDQFCISRKAIELGLKRAFIPGRFQIIEKELALLILDVAHNPAGGRCLAKRLAKEPCTGKTHAVVGMLADKDVANTLAALTSQVDYWYLATLKVPRGATADQLNKYLITINQPSAALMFSSPIVAVRHACKAAQKDDRMLVFGSFHTVGLILKDLYL